MKPATIAILVGSTCLAAVASAGVITTVTAHGATQGAPESASQRHAVQAARFEKPRHNPYFPLVPGTVTRLRGTDEGEHLRETVTVTHRTRTIQGVRTRVVRDVVRRADGSVAEKTHDWYAADRDGNVWYFGERTATYDENGDLESREGSWQAGRDGARAGLIMPADPHPTDAYRQEFRRGEAEDQAWIVADHATVRTPYRRFHDVVRSFEWSRLEPEVVSVKFYARGFGIVKERDVAGGDEVFRLVGADRP
jgi:hypothetical protein